jgi:hypothetical protein
MKGGRSMFQGRLPAVVNTLLFVNPANAIDATLYDKLNFVFLRDSGHSGQLIAAQRSQHKW